MCAHVGVRDLVQCAYENQICTQVCIRHASVWLLTCDRAYTQREYWWRPWVHCAHDWITHTLHMSCVHTNGFASIMGKWFVTVPDAQPSLLAALDVRLLVLVFSLTCGSSYLHSFFWHLGTFSVISGSTWSRRLKVIVEPIMQDIQVVIHSQWHLTQLQWRGSEVDDRGNGKDSKKVTGWWPNHFFSWLAKHFFITKSRHSTLGDPFCLGHSVQLFGPY